MKKKIIPIVLIFIATVLAVVGYILLPDVVAIQIGLDGQVSNSMPKLFAVVLPLLLSAITAFMYYKTEKGGHIAASVVGIFVLVFELIFNLR